MRLSSNCVPWSKEPDPCPRVVASAAELFGDDAVIVKQGLVEERLFFVRHVLEDAVQDR